MGEQKSKGYNSVDLTEDEDSSEGNSEIDNPFHFVDCSVTINEAMSPITHFGPPPDIFDSGAVSSSSQKAILKLPINPSSESVETTSNKKVAQFSSIQIKPPTDSNNPETVQQFETVSLDSDNEEPANHLAAPPPLLRNPQLLERTTEITLPKKDTIYSPKQPPGKVVIIKKNNKYYKIIIPHNVMPNISKSMGPVLINIPEVGPLVISNDPQATQAKSNPVKTQQLSLNLDAEEQKQESEAAAARKLKYEILKDKKFCWNFITLRKRDLEGFSSTDRLGFNKAEARKASKCERTVNFFLTRLRLELISKINEYEKFNKSLLKKDKIKLVKINSIIRASEKAKEKRNKIPEFEEIICEVKVEPFEEEMTTPLDSDLANTAVEADDYDSDLLVTKKVVILNSNNSEVGTAKKLGRTKRKGAKEISKVIKKHNLKKPTNCQIRPCYVQLSKDVSVEKAYLRYCTERGLNANKKHSIAPKVPGRVKNTPKKFVEANRVNPKQNHSNIFDKLLCKAICSTEHLKKELNILKPILIVTERSITTNRSLEYYCNEFSKNNIIFLVDSGSKFPSALLEAKGFVSAVEIGYVKLVEANLFGKYAANGMKFRMESDSCTEHNYSLIGK